jgi:hypothetical protein
MRIAYLDCASGISGDMTLGALVDAGVDLAAIQAGIDSLGLPSCRLARTEVKKKGFRATQIIVEHEPEHAHRHLHHITAMIEQSSLTARQRELAGRIFLRLAEAEAKVHGSTIEKVHFHEVGAVDSIADIVGAAIGWDLLGVERIVASPVPTGTGFVEIAHGCCAIPAPATGELLKGIPLAASSVAAELTTPTGAAILKALVDGFGPPPPMTIDAIGYGAGQRDLEEQANLLRLLVGDAADRPAGEQVWVVETNLDDATGEEVGHASERLWEAGALDVWTTPIGMKKNRPAVTLSVLCAAARRDAVETTLLCETSTLGVRRYLVERRTLPRQPTLVATPWGQVAGMAAELPGGGVRFAPEFEACRRLAVENQLPLPEVYRAARAAFQATRTGVE